MNKLTWNQYFIALAKISAMRSKDPNTKVGAVLVNDENRIIGLGYNGMPLGKDDFPWKREEKNKSNTKYPYVIHAEMNAVLNSIKDIKGSKLYVSLFPCSNCAKFLSQAGVKEIYFTDDKYKDTDDYNISKFIFKKCGVKTYKIKDLSIAIK